jgi:drug/metabolite transporter (DMT)-like permease
VAAVGLACFSAALFGAMSVALRIGMGRTPDPGLAALVSVVGALAVTLVATAAEAPARGVGLGDLWPFLLAGMAAPGLSQLLFARAIREAGSSRTSVVVGAAPLVSVAIALTLLDEPASVPLIIGAVLIVAGGVELIRERDRPEHVRLRGYALALAATVVFASRDNLVRWLADTANARPAAAAAASLVGAALVVVLARLVEGGLFRVRGWQAFVPAALLFGVSYTALFEAFFRARVTVVSPLVATESLWGVVFSALVLQRSELVGRRLVVGAALIVAGGALIGAFR